MVSFFRSFWHTWALSALAFVLFPFLRYEIFAMLCNILILLLPCLSLPGLQSVKFWTVLGINLPEQILPVSQRENCNEYFDFILEVFIWQNIQFLGFNIITFICFPCQSTHLQLYCLTLSRQLDCFCSFSLFGSRRREQFVFSSPKSYHIKLPQAFNSFAALQVCSNLAIIFW